MTTPNPTAALALRHREAAKALGISERLLWQLAHDGAIPCKRVGLGKRQTVLYPVAAIQEWLSQRDGAAKQEVQPNV